MFICFVITLFNHLDFWKSLMKADTLGICILLSLSLLTVLAVNIISCQCEYRRIIKIKKLSQHQTLLEFNFLCKMCQIATKRLAINQKRKSIISPQMDNVFVVVVSGTYTVTYNMCSVWRVYLFYERFKSTLMKSSNSLWRERERERHFLSLINVLWQ